jgi:hypothetical protein
MARLVLSVAVASRLTLSPVASGSLLLIHHVSVHCTL